MYDYEFFNNYPINIYHGRIITTLLAVAVGVISPLYFDIHPIEWMKTVGVCIKSIFIFISCYLVALSLFLFSKQTHKKIKNFYIVIFTTLLYFLYQQNTIDIRETMYLSYYGFILPFIVYFIFWRKFIKDFCNKNLELSLSLKDKFFFASLAFIIGCSAEFFYFSTFAILTFLLIVLFIKKKNNTIKNYMFIYFFNILGLIFFISNPGFTENVEAKLNIFSNFSVWVNEVITDLLITFRHDFIILFIIILVLFILISFLQIENKKEKILISFLYILGILSFYLSMAFCRRTDFYGYLYLIHFDIVFQIQIALIFIIIVLTSTIFEYKKTYNFLLLFFICCLVYTVRQNISDVFYLLTTNDKYYYRSKYYSYSDNFIKERYLSEYICLETIKQNKYIVTNEERETAPNISDFYSYMKKTYNIQYDIIFKESSIKSIEYLYNIFLSSNGTPISKEELEKHNFNTLLKRYRNMNYASAKTFPSSSLT